MDKDELIASLKQEIAVTKQWNVALTKLMETYNQLGEDIATLVEAEGNISKFYTKNDKKTKNE